LRLGRKTLALALLLVAIDPHSGAGAEHERREQGPQRVPFEEFVRRAHLREQAALLGTSPGFEAFSAGGLEWTFLGPQPLLSDYWSAGDPVSGRVSAVMVDPRDSNRVYIAAAQGGVWKSSDGGGSWTPLTDQLSSLASGALACDPVNPDIIYYGTGEQHLSGDSFYGDGVFRSTDQGLTWSQIGSRVATGSYIARIAVHAANPETLFVASSRGLVRTTNGGASWSATLQVWCTDLAVAAASPNRLFAAGYGSGVHRSTDAGATWTKLGGGLPVSGFFRINLAIAPSNPSVVYASFVTGNGGLLGMYRTTNGGDTWSLLPATPDYLGSQGWYDNCLVVDPANADVCYAGGVYPYGPGTQGVIVTTNGGASWTDITFDAFGNALHPDQHHMTFGPDGRLWVANDGGVWKRSASGEWLPRNAGLAITQFYTVGLHPTDPLEMLGGTQDNGTARYQGSIGWPQLIAGDGGPVAYEWDSPEIFYSTYVRLNPVDRWNAGAYDFDATGPWRIDGDPADWCNGPLEVDPNTANTLWAGTHRMWKSTDSGASWTDLSGDIAGGGVLLSLALRKGSPNLAYCGSSTGMVRFTGDGVTWFARNAGIPAEPVTDIAIDPTDPIVAFLSVDAANGGRVFRTTSYGVTWQNVTGNLPGDRRGLSLEVDFRAPQPRLYLGTDYGVYASLDGGATWTRASDGLPNLAVYDLAIDPVNDYLVAATHGRGMWRSSIDATPPDVAVTSANGSEAWAVGLVRHITWVAEDAVGVDSVTVQLSRNGGASWPETLAHGIPNSGDLPWTVTGPASAAGRLRVRAYDPIGNIGEDESNHSFSIVLPPVAVENAVGISDVALLPIAPNPGRAPFTIRFELPAAADVGLDVFDAAGRRVRSLAPGRHEAGLHANTWNGLDDQGRPLGDGVYWVRLHAGGVERARRFVLLR